MSEPPNRALPPEGTLPATVRGAALIGLAVILGLILLAQADGENRTAGPAARPATTTTTTVPTPTTTAPAGPARIPGELPIIVLNAGGPDGSAGVMSARLRDRGYTDQLDPADWPNEQVTGALVLCRAGLGREAAALSVDVGDDARIEEFPSPEPPNSDGADCVVAVGAAPGSSTSG